MPLTCINLASILIEHIFMIKRRLFNWDVLLNLKIKKIWANANNERQDYNGVKRTVHNKYHKSTGFGGKYFDNG